MPSSSRTESAAGGLHELAANRTFSLADVSRGFVVEEGKVLVFAVELVGGTALGRRHLLCTLEEGDGAFGVEGGRSAMELVATGIGSATVREIALPVAMPPDAPTLRAVEGWVRAVTERLALHKLPPGLSTLPPLPPGETLSVGPGSAVAPAEGCVWIACLEGAVFAAGNEETLTSAGEALLPIAEPGWVSAVESAVIGVSDTQTALSAASAWEGLRRFGQAAVDVMAREAAQEVSRREAASRRALLRDARMTEDAIADLAEVLPARKAAVRRRVDDALAEAVRAVEESLGVRRSDEEDDTEHEGSQLNQSVEDLAGPVARRATASAKETVAEEGASGQPADPSAEPETPGAAGSSGSTLLREVAAEQARVVAYSALLNRVRKLTQGVGCRARRATLPPRWWEGDVGPLVGFTESDWRPIALLRRGGRYEAYDPADGTRRKVDSRLAATLRPEAVAVSRGLAVSLHRTSTLLAHALHGSEIDIGKVVIFGSLSGLASLVVPLATGLVFNTIVPDSQRHRLIVLVGVLVLVALGVAVGSLARGVAFVRVQARSVAAAQMSVWDRLLRLPASFFGSYAVGELMTRTQSIQLSQQIMSDAVMANLLNGIFGIFNVVLLLTGGTKLFVIGVVLLLLQFVTLTWANLIALTPAVTETLEAQNKTQALTLQVVRGMHKLRVAAAESRAFAVWARRFAAQQHKTYQQGKFRAFSGAFTVVWPTVTWLSVIVGAIWTGSGNLGLGNYVAYTTAFTQASMALITIAAGLAVTSLAVSHLEQIQPILEATEEVGAGREDPGELRGKVAISHVAFRYHPEGPLVLKDVTIRANPGEFVAIVGPSGAGKSSIMRLLLGFDTPENGVVAYDDRDLSLLDSTMVRRQIGSVIQGARLLPGTIFSNIAGGLPITRDDAWDAARAAGIDNDIAEMPMGMETVIQEGGGTLSGGQGQRILIARALALKPKIIFFDEATSALDNITQAQVTESVNKLQVTRVVIAHRLSTIKDADRIFVLVAGEVVQEGSYEELMAVEGPFRSLAQRQLT